MYSCAAHFSSGTATPGCALKLSSCCLAQPTSSPSCDFCAIILAVSSSRCLSWLSLQAVRGSQSPPTRVHSPHPDAALLPRRLHRETLLYSFSISKQIFPRTAVPLAVAPSSATDLSRPCRERSNLVARDLLFPSSNFYFLISKNR